MPRFNPIFSALAILSLDPAQPGVRRVVEPGTVARHPAARQQNAETRSPLAAISRAYDAQEERLTVRPKRVTKVVRVPVGNVARVVEMPHTRRWDVDVSQPQRGGRRHAARTSILAWL